ncbi:choice-of-anchor Q domain-containing protein [Arsenicibacter rosenii]|uniref:Ig-like domain-containing protein n=1 Tax=Arsenicibacter rosenii TaxID=1750698 RepID=A0A1S2VNY7_9BACT|nr:choice-of-anchor Q domain-containing protein [Arsenicibacter rosenii]OIN60487.1 hypothetical protein BLX24_06620 [Arsenicibacter rosenii]
MAQNKIYYVTPTGTTPAASATTSWATSTSDLQGAISASQATDQIWVAAGVYKPTSTTTNRNASFALKNGVTIYGGFRGDETSPDDRTTINPLTSQPSATTLSGDIDNNGTLTNNSYHVFYHPASLSINSTAILNGVVITGGNASASTPSDPNSFGGGMYNQGSSPKLINCVFQGNGGTYGAALSCLGNSNPLLINCNLQSNSSPNSGGGAFSDASSFTLINCSVQNNQAPSGGGIFNQGGSNPLLINCTLKDNVATTNGGAIFNQTNSNPTVTNSVLWNNGGSKTFSGNTIMATYNLIEAGVTGFSSSTTNLSTTVSPFMSATSISLNACSPAINAGNPASVTVATGPYSETALPATDLTGNARINGGRIDIGAVEFQPGQAAGPFARLYVAASQTANTGDGLSWATAFSDLQSALTYPCSQSLTEIWVAGGLYKPTSTTNNRSAGFALRNGVTIYGGFRGTESSLDDRPEINPLTGKPSSTTLSGDIDNDGTLTNNSYHVFYHPASLSINSSAVLNGVVITGGTAPATSPSDPNSFGGGMYNAGSSPTLIKCVFQGNRGYYGAAMSCLEGSNPVLTDCSMESNTSTNSGGVTFSDASSFTLINCKLQNNRATNGGAIFNQGSSNPFLRDCSLQDNTATNHGGAVFNQSNSRPTLTNCGLAGNTAARGGAIFNTTTSSPTLTSCSLASNTAAENGGAIYNENSSNPVLTSCSLASNKAFNGGAISNQSSSNPVLTNCSLISNRATNRGGAIFSNSDSSTLTGCILTNNTAGYGGAIHNENNSNLILTNCSLTNNLADLGGAVANINNANPVITNCIFSGNVSNFNGGAIYNASACKPLIVNSFLYNNSSLSQAGAIYNFDVCSVTLINCSLQGNTVSSTKITAAIHNDNSRLTLLNSVFWQNGNSNSILDSRGSTTTARDCLFDAVSYLTDPTNLTTAVSPFVSTTSAELIACSPAINAGNPASVTAASGPYSVTAMPATDLAGNARIANGRIDMGAVEYQSTTNIPLVIVKQPLAGSVVCAGTTVVMSVSVTGSSPAYQWYKDGTALTGIASATTASLTLPNVQTAYAGSYSVVISGDCPSLTSTAFSLKVPPATARLYVAASQTANTGDGLSWATAFSDLQSALTYPCSQSLTEIWVAGGLYKPTSTTNNRSAGFAMRNGVTIYGGFQGGETSVNDRPEINPLTGKPSSTTLSGDIDNDGALTNNSYHVFYHPASLSINSSAVLNGVVITGGTAPATSPSDPNSFGGGMYNAGSSPTLIKCVFQGNRGYYGAAMSCLGGSNPVLTDCSMESNTSTNSGGVTFSEASSFTLINCRLQNNRATNGGAIFNQGSSNPLITNCTLQGNVVTNSGGAIYNQTGSSPVLTSCSLKNNTSTNRGGAIYNNSSSPVLTSCSLTGNAVYVEGVEADTRGGAIYNLTGSNPILTSCVLTSNTAYLGGAIFNESSSPILTSCILSSNSARDAGALNNQEGSHPRLTDCTLSNNTATFGGAVVSWHQSQPVFTNCRITDNLAKTEAGAIYNLKESRPLFLNCIISNNTSLSLTGLMASVSACSPVFINCSMQGNIAQTRTIYNSESRFTFINSVLWNNGSSEVITNINNGTATATYSLFDAASYIADPTNLTTAVSPFVSTTSAELIACSPAINAGNPLIVTATSGPYSETALPATDLAGNARIANGRVDMGAAEYQSTTNIPLVIVQQPVAGSAVCAGTTVVMSVSATGSSPVYQWYKDGTALTGIASATTASLTLPNVQPADAGSYSVVISGDCPSLTSTAFSLSVNTLSVTVTAAPSATLSCANPSLTLTAQTSATAFVWSNGGSTGQTLPVSTTGVYSVTVTGADGCTAVSNSLTISQDFTSPTVSISAVSTTLTCAQPQLTLTATASATALLWSTGETTATIAVSTTGVYSVTATGANGCTAVSNNLTVARDNTSPTVSVSAAGTTLTCTQPQLTLTATASVTALRWSTGETTATISVSTAGTYSVTATNANGCTAVSNNLPVTESFGLPPFTVSSATVCPGQSVTLTASGCSGQIRWSTGATTSLITLTAGNSTSLLTATCTVGVCSTTASGQVVIGGALPPPAQILSFVADESACPVRLVARGVATSFTMTGPKGYVFSTVYREGGTHDAVGLNVKQAGTYTLTATYTNSCGTSAPVTRTVTVGRSCP